MLTLAGAGASLAIMLLVLGEPALRACVPDQRGTFACLREAAVERLNLPVGQVANTPSASADEIPAPEVMAPLVIATEAEPQAISAPVATPTAPPTPVVAAETPAKEVSESADVEPVAEPEPLAVPEPILERVAEPKPEPEPEPEPEFKPALEVAAEPAPQPRQDPLVTAAIEPETPQLPYVPTPGKLERPQVTLLPDNVAAPATPDLTTAPLPAETGSIETPVAPAVEALVEPELIELPQLPPPPLAPERAEAPPASPQPVAPIETASAPTPEPAQLADQPLPSSALPAPQVVAPVPPQAAAPADTAAAAATAIADPAQPILPAPALPPVLAPAPASPAIPVAAVPPIPSEPAPDVTATPPTDPTIDTIAFDLTGTIVAGDGPQGAIIHLYVDTELAGEGAVLDGRWEVIGAPLFAAPLQILRAVAVDPETGRVLGETEISIELEVPESTMPPTVDEVAAPPAEPERRADTAPQPEAAAAPETPDTNLTADVSPEPAGAAPPEIVAPAPTEIAAPKLLPPLRTVVPRGETTSVTILPDSRSRLVEQPGSGFAILGD